MITLFFDFGNEKIFIKIDGKDIKFGNTIFGAQLANIDGLKLNYLGVCKEHPDLKGDKEWKEKSIKRFKTKINKMANEDDIANYLINDLRKYGYVPKLKQKRGFRPRIIR